MEWMALIFVAGLAGLLYYRQSLLTPVKIETAPNALYHPWHDMPYNIGQPGQEGFWNRAVLVITPKEVRLQTRQEKAVRFNATVDELRGFWLIDNEVWLHAHIGSEWYVLQLRPPDRNLCLKALAQVTRESTPPPLDLIPYPALQAGNEVMLYLAPHSLVVSRHGLVQHTLDVQQISAVQNTDDTLTFTAGGQQWAFTLPDAAEWVSALQHSSGTPQP